MLKIIIIALFAFLFGAIIGALDLALVAAKRLGTKNQSQQKEKEEIESVTDEPVTE